MLIKEKTKGKFPGEHHVVWIGKTKHTKLKRVLPWTVNVADEVTTPRIFLALHVYTPPSCDVTSPIIRPLRVCTILLSAVRREFSFSHVTWGIGFPLTSHCNEAKPVSFTTMEDGGDTIEGAEMDSPGSPLGPWGPWSPLGLWSGGTRPSSSSPDTLRAMRHAGQVSHRQFNLPVNVISTDDFADVRSP